MSELYTQDYLQEDEDICDFCTKVKKHSELKEYDGEKGGRVRVCDTCVATGWAEG
ncbi:hypothetical protein LCGC14_2815850 [marine sediment metagenome]|uniref:ClpX-type ZB domain-containing protein n=1 Tax=marine sediment metagenome TaxID=412755 RepID=A0A0F9ARW9_9ZZZZ